MQLPKYIHPMEPVTSPEIPLSDNYIHSVKWDGVRQFIYCENTGVRIHNRRLNNRTNTYPELHTIHNLIKGKDFLLDGELVAIHNGKPNFQQVMKRDFVRSMETAERLIKSIPITYMVFDLLYYNGESMMNKSLSVRLELLREIIKETTDFFQIVDHVEDGTKLLSATENLQLEGVVSKNKESIYRQGRKHPDWLKIKHFKDVNVVIGGYTTKNNIVNSLSLGIYDRDELQYVGNAATGLSSDELLMLTKELKKHVRDSSPFMNFQICSKHQFWVVPQLTLKVSYLELTNEGRLRHPIIEGFLTINPKECIFE